jgi:hypothetical protein
VTGSPIVFKLSEYARGIASDAGIPPPAASRMPTGGRSSNHRARGSTGQTIAGGTIARPGQRLLDTTSQMTIKKFFEKLVQAAVE